MKIIPDSREIEQQRQQVEHEDLERYRQLGVVQKFVIQADSDEDAELQWMDFLLDDGVAPQEMAVYVAEPGAKDEGRQDHSEHRVLAAEGDSGL